MPEHAHKYRRRILGKDYIVLKCVLPGCNHYCPPQMAEGKIAKCWICEGPFVMNVRSIKMSKPRCPHCRRGKPKEIDEGINKLLESLK